MNNTLVVLLGPTAVGKTDLSLELAHRWSCPIISADSRQIYKEIPIGTAAPTKMQLAAVKHYFVNILDLDAYYSAAQYEKEALDVIERCFKTNHHALLTGGSMMYIDAVCKGIDDIPTVHEDVRMVLQERYEQYGLQPLRAELALLDPVYYNEVDKQNPKRVIHALEICIQTGKPYSSFRTLSSKKRSFRILKIGLYRSRSILFDRINQRVDLMLKNGFIEEAKRVYDFRHLNSLNTVGYKELFEVFSGNWPLDMAIERIKKNTRVYAKKQITWFKKDPEVMWMNMDKMTNNDILDEVEKIILLKDKGESMTNKELECFRLSSW